MRGFVLTVAMAVLGATLSAQTREAVVSAASLQLGPGEIPQAVETDGDFSTTEWLIRKAFTMQFRVIAIQRDGHACMGAWFTPTTDIFPTITVQRVGLVHKLLIRESASDHIVLIALNTPACHS